MTFAFDLISDLHVDTWKHFDWTDQATAPYCVVAGDVGRDRNLVASTLEHLGKCYHGVFYIDGNDEHRYHMNAIDQSYDDLTLRINHIKLPWPNKIVYLQDNVIVINGVAIVAVNGWWDYNFDLAIDPEQSMLWYKDYIEADHVVNHMVLEMAWRDSTYLANTIKDLQTHPDVKKIAVVSHTVPAPWIVNHDLDLSNSHRFNCLGNSSLEQILEIDTEKKISTWCFGHYHKCVDQFRDKIRYVSNPRGRANTDWCQPAYFPKRIEIEL